MFVTFPEVIRYFRKVHIYFCLPSLAPVVKML